MAGEGRVHERVLPFEEFEHRAVVADDVEDEADRLLEHRAAEFVVEGLEAAAIDAVVLLEPAEVEPVAAELGRKAADAVVAEHPPGLGDEDLGALEFACRGAAQQLVVGHARPEEIAQAAGQVVIAQGPDARPLAFALEIDPVAEVGRHQDADEGVADRVLVAEAVLVAEGAVEVAVTPRRSSSDSGRR